MIWIDLFAAGVKIGSGPITSLRSWRYTRRLDRAGEFKFLMPASDPKANYLAAKTQIRAYRDSIVGPVLIGRGFIDQIAVRVDQGQAGSMLEISGADMLRELTYRTVGDLDLFDENSYSPTQLVNIAPGSATVLTDAFDGNAGTEAEDVTIDTHNDGDYTYLYIGYTSPFDRVSINVGTSAQSNAVTLLGQYYNEDSGGWEALDIVSDGTESGGATMAQDGIIEWRPPQSWGLETTESVQAYYVRLLATGQSSTFDLAEVSVLVKEPTPDALDTIMDMAAGISWSLDTVDGYAATESEVYLLMAGESVLAALIRLAEHTGEHFRLATGLTRKVVWLQDDVFESGYRLMAPQYSAIGDVTKVLPILSVERVEDTYELVTRVYPHGGGSGAGRVTLASTTRAASVGYTLSTSGNYLEQNAAVALYGQIDRYMSWPDIVAATTEQAQLQNAADALYDRCYQYLLRASQPAAAYRVRVAAGGQNVQVGQRVRVVYHEFVDGYHAVDIDADLWVLEISEEHTADGQQTAEFVVSVVDRWPASDQAMVVATASRDETDRAVQKPQARYTAVQTGGGNVYNIVVKDGQVTVIQREIPVADGDYIMGDRITPSTGALGQISIRNGIIVAIEEAS